MERIGDVTLTLRYFGIDTDGHHTEYQYTLNDKDLSEILLKKTQENFNSRTIRIEFKEPDHCGHKKLCKENGRSIYHG